MAVAVRQEALTWFSGLAVQEAAANLTGSGAEGLLFCLCWTVEPMVVQSEHKHCFLSSYCWLVSTPKPVVEGPSDEGQSAAFTELELALKHYDFEHCCDCVMAPWGSHIPPAVQQWRWALYKLCAWHSILLSLFIRVPFDTEVQLDLISQCVSILFPLYSS